MPPGFGLGIEDTDRVSEAHQVEGGGQAGRSGPDDGHLFPGRLRVVLEGCPDDGLVAHVWQFVAVLRRPSRPRSA